MSLNSKNILNLGVNYFYPLIGVLRTFAVFLVLIYHVIEVGKNAIFPVMQPFINFYIGWIGVDLFFVISGFVITLNIYKEFLISPGNYKIKFLECRLARIFPLYFLTSVLFVLVVDQSLLLKSISVQFYHYFSHLFFFHNVHPATHGSINGPSWSVALEMQFYLMMIFMFFWIRKIKISTLIFSLLIIAWLYRFVLTLVLEPGVANPNSQMIYTYLLPGTIDQFGVGILIAVVRINGEKMVDIFFSPNWLIFLMSTVLSVSILLITVSIYWNFSAYWNNTGMIVFWRTLLSLGFGCALVAAMTFPYPKAAWLRPLMYLGEISYGIYLWHMLVLLVLINSFKLAGVNLLVGVIVVTCLLASLSWHAMERPLMEWVRRRYAKA